MQHISFPSGGSPGKITSLQIARSSLPVKPSSPDGCDQNRWEGLVRVDNGVRNAVIGHCSLLDSRNDIGSHSWTPSAPGQTRRFI
jgi:hypothetical protein